MSTVEAKLRVLKTRFTRSLAGRFSGIAHAMQKLKEGDGDAIRELERSFHTLAGTAGTYGLAAMSALASDAEEICERLTLPDDEAVRKLASLVETLERASEEREVETPFVPALKPAAKPARVLCVEDDPDYAAYLCAILRGAGYEASVARDAFVFDEAIADFRPDMILLDINLGDDCGLDLARRLRKQEDKTTLPIVFVTAKSSIEARINGIRAGGDDFLVKPVVPELLLATVASRLERSQAVTTVIDRDDLTRLSTQGAFARRMEAAVAEGRPVCLVMLDIDHFKSVNDRYGHVIGDRVLTSFARFLRNNVREGDVVGRCGGEEFGILLPGMSPEDAQALTERLLHGFGGVPHAARGGVRFFVTFSAGVATLHPSDDVPSWKQRADDALYEAKRGGRARVEAA